MAKPKRKKGARYVGSKWESYDGEVKLPAPPATHCAHCGDELVAGSHSPLEMGNFCANMRLHALVEDLRGRIRELEEQLGTKVEPEAQIDVVSEEIGFEALDDVRE